jgi:hypothetical protein
LDFFYRRDEIAGEVKVLGRAGLPRLGIGIGIVPGARLGVERRGLGRGEGWVAADLDLGGGEWWREEARWGG